MATNIAAKNWEFYKVWLFSAKSDLHIAHLAQSYRRKTPWVTAMLPYMESDPDWEKIFPQLLAWCLANSE